MFSHAKLPPATQLAMLAAAAFGTYVVYSIATKGFRGAASAITEGVVNTANDIVGGAVIGAGRAVGVPETDAQKCAAALRERRLWDASFACPVGDFVRGMGRAGADAFRHKQPVHSDGLMGAPSVASALWPALAVGALVVLCRARP